LQARNAALSLVYQVTGALFTAGLTIFLVRKLGSDDYGVLALATGIAAIVVLLSDLGISQATARFVAENVEQPETVRHFVREALLLKLVAALAASGLLALLAEPIADAYGIAELTTALRVVAIAVFGQSMMFLGFAFYEATAKNEGALLLAMVESFTETSTSIALVVLGGGVTGAIAGRAAGYMAAGVLAIWLVTRAVGLRARPSLPRPGGHARTIFNYALSLSVIDGVMTLFARLDVLLIGAYLGAGPAGVFEAPLRLTTTLQYVGTSIASGFAPRLANAAGEGDPEEVFRVGLRWLIVFQCFATVLVVVWATPIVALTLGPGFGESADVLRALGPYVFLAGLAALLTMGVNYVGEARKRVPIAILAVLVNLAVDVVLIPRIGVVAGAIGSGLAMAIYVPAHLWILRDRIGLRLRGPAVTLLRSALAGLAMAIPMLAAGTGSLSVAEWIWGGAGAIVAYCGVLVLSGEVSRDELRRIFAWASGRI
jgi:O-antigen/teichoic acid export membrane protein